ncbi:hypothetical protein KKG71_06325 [Patescibacteria group bacterium]|nr:hypothetical protein [Patescibacteria group bacterium]
MKNPPQFKKKYPNLHTIIVVASVVLVWRGIWGLLDLYLFPSNPALSYLTSTLLGLIILWIDDFHLNELR